MGGSLDGTDAMKVAMSVLVYLVGTVGNVLVIFMILYLGETKKISHWYVLQLAFADVVFLQSLPFYMMDVIHGSFAHPAWFCKLKETVLYVNYYGSIIFLSIMAIDRYFAVCHGLSKVAERLRSRRNCKIVTLLAWAVAVLMCIPVTMYADLDRDCKCMLKFPPDKLLYCDVRNFNGSKCDEKYLNYLEEEQCRPTNDSYFYSGDYSSEFSDLDYTTSAEREYGYGDDAGNEVCVHSAIYPALRTFLYFNFLVMFVLPLTIISICYGLIVIRLRNTEAKLRRSSERSDSSGHSCNENIKLARGRSSRRKSSSAGATDKHKIRVTVMCATLVVLFLVCWLPYHAVHLAKIAGFYPSTVRCHVAETVTLLLVYVNSALNPYLYNFLGTFGKRMRDIRKHRRTKEMLGSIRWTKMRRSLSHQASDSVKHRKTSDGAFHLTQTSAVRDETPSTQRADSSSGNDNIHSPERQNFM